LSYQGMYNFMHFVRLREKFPERKDGRGMFIPRPSFLSGDPIRYRVGAPDF